MSSIITKPRTGGAGIDLGGGSRGWGGGGGEPSRSSSVSTARLGMTFGLAGIAMLFIALTSAYVVRHGLDPDWRYISMPRILAANTVVLVASSITLELARRLRSRLWMRLTLVLGAIFVAGQLIAWNRLSSAGVYLSTNPHASFFYLLTGLHGLHLLGGIGALVYVAGRMRAATAHPARALEATALYWHFMDGLWLYLFLLLFVWR